MTGFNPIHFDGLNQLFKAGATADSNAVQAGALEHQFVRIGIALAPCEHADQGGFPFSSDTLKRAAGERSDAAIFDHAIDAASFVKRALPFPNRDASYNSRRRMRRGEGRARFSRRWTR